MRLGWRPKELGPSGAPIPLSYKHGDGPPNSSEPLYLGPRFLTSLEMHRQFANKPDAYEFEFPTQATKIKKSDPPRAFVGMNPALSGDIKFDSNFESGNLDEVVQISKTEFDLYMRVDTNTRGHL